MKMIPLSAKNPDLVIQVLQTQFLNYFLQILQIPFPP